VEQGDLGGEAGEEQGFFHGRIAAADHRNLLAAEEKAIAGGATGNAVADQRLLAGMPSQRALAPEATIRVRAQISPPRCAAETDGR